ncbi:hypothetical protein HELRODRAFT_163981 [Helobdella robusta]|uniref:Uncharacterized protein n=1 Tax=Helobdella robusta TaxID=6412 RepID=T1EUQ0_HELRO|nr:hypothetical protein HELRODRAFT_163981 [Helobdella robusta]ESN94191.1 hypothetical protein HELRODRAFT_163981 [Helobdella robusta]
MSAEFRRKGQGKIVNCFECENFAHGNCVSVLQEVCNFLDSSTNSRRFWDSILNDLNAHIMSEFESINATIETYKEKLNQLEGIDVFRGELSTLKNEMKVSFADIVSHCIKGHVDDIKAETPAWVASDSVMTSLQSRERSKIEEAKAMEISDKIFFIPCERSGRQMESGKNSGNPETDLVGGGDGVYGD